MAKNPIKIKAANKGKLHEELGVPEGQKISTEQLELAKASASPAEKKRIQFAENARKWQKNKVY